jgi:hypothetical protein
MRNTFFWAEQFLCDRKSFNRRYATQNINEWQSICSRISALKEKIISSKKRYRCEIIVRDSGGLGRVNILGRGGRKGRGSIIFGRMGTSPPP